MKNTLIGIVGALLGIALFAGGITCGHLYSTRICWGKYSVFTQMLGDAAVIMAALQTFDEESPEAARQHLASMLAYQVITLDILLPQSNERRIELSQGLLALVAEHNRKHPFNLKYPEVEKQLNAILYDSITGTPTN